MKKILSLLAVLFFLAFPIHATVTDTESPVKVYTSGSVTAYPIPFDYIDDEDIKVTLVNSTTGAETAQTLDVDYTIVSSTVTYAKAPGAAYRVVIRRVTPYTQEASWVAGSAPPLSAYESVFDKLTFLAQDLNERLGRALSFSVTSTADPTLPDPALNAGRLLRVNLDGDGIDTLAVADAGVYPDYTAYCDPADLMYLHRNAYQPIGYVRRSKFSYVNTTTFTIGPGVYNILGAAGGWRTVFWSSDLTFTSPAAYAAWRYLYISDSASAVDAPRELEASDFVASSTAPSWSAAKQGWYNGNDRCIFAYYVDSSNEIWPFYHDGGDYVHYGTSFIDRSTKDLNSKTAVTVSIPAFSQRGKFTVAATLNGGYDIRVSTGASAFDFTSVGIGVASTYTLYPLFDHYVSSSRQLYLDLSETTGTNIVSLWTLGWYFPAGM